MKLVLSLLLLGASLSLQAEVFNPKDFGARGDGKHLDSPAINEAIEKASAAGGGTVVLSPGVYLSGSIRLKNNIELVIEEGTTVLAAPQKLEAYDETEPFLPPAWQDGGHTYFHNSLIWGENLTNVTIRGKGKIDGTALSKAPGMLSKMCGFRPDNTTLTPQQEAELQATIANPIPNNGMPPVRIGDKAIALKLCKNVTIRDITIFRGGWFAILATGCDDVILEDLLIDTGRDGIDIDACRNVLVNRCRVNSPEDDAICPKSTYVLGEARPCENIVIKDCEVSGFELGTLIDGTRKPDPGDRRNGRIKFGTESSGGFRNCTVTNCTFESSMGFALEEVDGGILENIKVSNLRMKNVKNYALYIVTGKRNRTPNLKTNSRMRNVEISDVIAEGVDTMSGIQIFGLPEEPIEDLRLKNIRIVSKGGGTTKDAKAVPKELGTAYPDPSGKGNMPAYGIFARNVRGLVLEDLDLSFTSPDVRPAAKFTRVDGLKIDGLKAATVEGVKAIVLERDVTGATITNVSESNP